MKPFANTRLFLLVVFDFLLGLLGGLVMSLSLHEVLNGGDGVRGFQVLIALFLLSMLQPILVSVVDVKLSEKMNMSPMMIFSLTAILSASLFF